MDDQLLNFTSNFGFHHRVIAETFHFISMSNNKDDIKKGDLIAGSKEDVACTIHGLSRLQQKDAMVSDSRQKSVSFGKNLNKVLNNISKRLLYFIHLLIML